jgi:hypothetical protein
VDRDGIVAASPAEVLAGAKIGDYRAGVRAMTQIVIIQALVIAGLTVFLFLAITGKEDNNRYFAVTSSGRKMQLQGLPLPNMGRAALSAWAAQSASQIMTFGFNDIDERFAISRKHFTAKGWESFRKAMIAAKVIEDVTKSQQIVTTVPKSTPRLISEGLVRGTYTWTFDTPLLITFRAGSAKTVRSSTVRTVLERVSTRDNPNGIGIGEWYMY